MPKKLVSVKRTDKEQSHEIKKMEIQTVDLEDLEFQKIEEVFLKSKKYERVFKLSWEHDKRFSKWLIRSPNNLPFCQFCGIELKATGGTKDLKYHMSTKKHTRNAKMINQQLDSKLDVLSCNDEEIDMLQKDVLSKNYSVHYEFETDGKDTNIVNENTELKIEDDAKSDVSEKSCVICGDSLCNMKNSENTEKVLDTIRKFINIEEERAKIQFEMKELVEKMDNKKDLMSKTPLESFANILISDMSKLPDSVQRKLRMNIMLEVDTELLKIETS